jgi:hypothetical protein
MNNQETQGTTNDVDPASVDRVVLLLERIAKAESYRAGAWAKVIEAGRQYARLKAFGWMIENGARVNMCQQERDMMTKHFADVVLRECIVALSEDAMPLE